MSRPINPAYLQLDELEEYLNKYRENPNQLPLVSKRTRPVVETMTDEKRLEVMKWIAESNPTCVNPCGTCRFSKENVCLNIISKALFVEPLTYRRTNIREDGYKAYSCKYMRSNEGLCGPRGLLWQPKLLRRLKFWKDW